MTDDDPRQRLHAIMQQVNECMRGLRRAKELLDQARRAHTKGDRQLAHILRRMAQLKAEGVRRVMAGPIVKTVLADWCDIECPCGAWVSTRHMTNDEYQTWMAEHASHSDGTIVTHHPEWHRFCGGEPPASTPKPLPPFKAKS